MVRPLSKVETRAESPRVMRWRFCMDFGALREDSRMGIDADPFTSGG